MEGRVPKGGLLAVFVNCSDPSKEAEMNAWYNTVHAPDVTRPGVFTDFTRFVNPTAKGTTEDPRYLAIYETGWGNVAEAAERFRAGREGLRRWSAESRLHPALSLAKVSFFKSHGSKPVCPPGRRTRGILVVMTDCSDPARTEEFDRWYDEVHIPEVIGTGCYWSAMRYRSIDPPSQDPRYLALYETEDDGVETVGRFLPRLDRKKSLSVVRLRYLAGFNLLYSQQAAAPPQAPQG